MQIVIDIDEDTYNDIKKGKIYSSFRDVPLESVNAIANGIPLGEKELKLKRYIEKDIETLNYIIESGWLISDYDECTAISACEDAIKALKQYSVLDKIRAEIEQTVSRYSISRERGCMGQVEWSDRLIKESEVLQIIDKYRAESEE